MPPRIEENILTGLFEGRTANALTTEATFWSLPTENGLVARYRSVFVPGKSTLVINGQERTFSDGAYVFDKNGKLEAVNAKQAAGGGITVRGGSPEAMGTDPFSRIPQGNMATLGYNEGPEPGTGRLYLDVPREQGHGFSFRYPGSSEAELAQRAEDAKAIVRVKDADGKIIEGFLTEGKGGVLPPRIDQLQNGVDLSPGEFVEVGRRVDGSAYLYRYRNYTPEQLDSATRQGTFRHPDNDIAKLTDLDGKPLNKESYPKVNVEPTVRGTTVESAQAKQPDVEKSEGTTGPTDAKASRVDASEPKAQTPPRAETSKVPDAPNAPAGSPTAKVAPPADGSAALKEGAAVKDGAALSESTAGIQEGAAGLGKLAKFVAPVALGTAPLVEGVGGAVEEYKQSGSALDAAGGGIKGAGKGVVDTFLPGAREGYSDIAGGGDRTMLDRALNAVSDASGTATAVGSAAVLAEGAGVLTIPATIPTGTATVLAGITNLGVNAAKGVLKATGLAGKDQDGGYIYEGARAIKHGIQYALSTGQKNESHEEQLLRQSTGGADKTVHPLHEAQEQKNFQPPKENAPDLRTQHPDHAHLR